MRMIATVLIVLISLLHFYIAWFEIFAWTTRGPAVFSTLAPELFEPTIALAANQGIYNAFLAAGLLWSVVIRDKEWSTHVGTCFLLFVAVAGVFGAATVELRIMFIQTVPSVIAMVLLQLGQSRARAQ